MSTIFEPINGDITRQLDLRQKVMSNEIRNPNVRSVFLNKKCTIRLVPLVKDLTTIENINILDSDDFIFDNYTLTDNFFDNIINSDLINNSEFSVYTSYKNNFNNTKEKPFVKDFNIITRSGNNYGATRIGSITIIIPTRDQFNLIERFFRIGSPFLLEWGWSKYILDDTSSEFLSFIDDTLYKQKPEIKQIDLENAIIRKKIDNKGNYDGGVFVINNFTTTIQNGSTDYYYELKLDLITKGDILNSIKPSKNVSVSSTSTDYATTYRINSNPLIRALRFLNQYQSGYKEELKNKEISLEITIAENIEGELTPEIETIELNNILSILHESTPVNNSVELSLNPFSNIIQEIDSNFLPIKKTVTRENQVRLPTPGLSPGSFQSSTTSNKEITYIKLGYFLQMLNRLKTKTDPGYVDLGYEYSNPEYYYTLQGDIPNSFKYEWNSDIHFGSFNPSKVILPNYKWTEFLSKYVADLDFFISYQKRFIISNILLRTNVLLDEVINLIKQDEFTFNNIIKMILDLINTNTDNELRLTKYDLENGSYTIASLTNSNPIINNPFSLKLYNTGSIVESVTIDTTINDSVAKEVAIMFNGSPDYAVSAEAVSLLKFNHGTKSRLVENNNTNIEDNQNSSIGYLNFIEENLFNLHKNIFSLTENPNIDTISTDLLNYYQNFKQKYISGISLYGNYKNIRAVPLFPIKIKITLPGVSGIKIGNSLKIEDSRLPAIYTDNKIYYLITNIEHQILNRYWNTLLDLSPQINTDITQLSISSTSTDINQPLNVNDIGWDLDTFLKALIQVETGIYEFESIVLNRPGIIDRWRRKGTETWNNSPLFSQASQAISAIRARGPYQIKPAYVFDALGNQPNISNIEKKGEIWQWDKVNELVNIDTIFYQKQAVERYLNRYFPKEINKKTYKRASAIHHLGPIGGNDYNEVKRKISEGLKTNNKKWSNIRNNFIYFENTYWPKMKEYLGIDPNSLIDAGQPNNFNF
jgi:hypothetical protein